MKIYKQIINIFNTQLLSEGEEISADGDEAQVKSDLAMAIDEIIIEEDKELFNDEQIKAMAELCPKIKNVFGLSDDDAVTEEQDDETVGSSMIKGMEEALEYAKGQNKEAAEDVIEAQVDDEEADIQEEESKTDIEPVAEKSNGNDAKKDGEMEFVDRAELLEMLKQISPGLSAGKKAPKQTDHFVFKNGQIMTFNDSTAASVTFKTGIEGAVKGKEFLKLLKKLKDDSLRIKTENGKLIIKGQTNVEIALAEPEWLAGTVNAPAFKSEKWMKLPGNFADAIKVAFKTASKKYEMFKSVCFSGQYAYATDSFKAVKYYLDSPIEKDFTIDVSVVKKIADNEPSYYYVDNNWNHFLNGNGVVVSTRVIDYVHLESVSALFDSKADQYIDFPEDMKEVVGRVGTMSIEEYLTDRTVEIEFKKGSVECRATSRTSKASESIDHDFVHDGSFSFKVNPDDMCLALDNSLKAELGRSLIFKCDSFEYLIQLIG